MPSRCATVEIYPEYDKDGSVDYALPFSYGCPDLDLMGYSDITQLILDIRAELSIPTGFSTKGKKP